MSENRLPQREPRKYVKSKNNQAAETMNGQHDQAAPQKQANTQPNVKTTNLSKEDINNERKENDKKRIQDHQQKKQANEKKENWSDMVEKDEQQEKLDSQKPNKKQNRNRKRETEEEHQENGVGHVAPGNETNLLEWTSDNVAAWLESCGLGGLVQTFKRNDISGETLPYIGFDNLKDDLKILSYGQRVRFWMASTELLTEHNIKRGDIKRFVKKANLVVEGHSINQQQPQKEKPQKSNQQQQKEKPQQSNQENHERVQQYQQTKPKGKQNYQANQDQYTNGNETSYNNQKKQQQQEQHQEEHQEEEQQQGARQTGGYQYGKRRYYNRRNDYYN